MVYSPHANPNLSVPRVRRSRSGNHLCWMDQIDWNRCKESCASSSPFGSNDLPRSSKGSRLRGVVRMITSLGDRSPAGDHSSPSPQMGDFSDKLRDMENRLKSEAVQRQEAETMNQRLMAELRRSNDQVREMQAMLQRLNLDPAAAQSLLAASTSTAGAAASPLNGVAHQQAVDMSCSTASSSTSVSPMHPAMPLACSPVEALPPPLLSGHPPASRSLLDSSASPAVASSSSASSSKKRSSSSSPASSSIPSSKAPVAAATHRRRTSGLRRLLAQEDSSSSRSRLPTIDSESEAASTAAVASSSTIATPTPLLSSSRRSPASTRAFLEKTRGLPMPCPPRDMPAKPGEKGAKKRLKLEDFVPLASTKGQRSSFSDSRGVPSSVSSYSSSSTASSASANATVSSLSGGSTPQLHKPLAAAALRAPTHSPSAPVSPLQRSQLQPGHSHSALSAQSSPLKQQQRQHHRGGLSDAKLAAAELLREASIDARSRSAWPEQATASSSSLARPRSRVNSSCANNATASSNNGTLLSSKVPRPAVTSPMRKPSQSPGQQHKRAASSGIHRAPNRPPPPPAQRASVESGARPEPRPAIFVGIVEQQPEEALVDAAARAVVTPTAHDASTA